MMYKIRLQPYLNCNGGTSTCAEMAKTAHIWTHSALMLTSSSLIELSLSWKKWHFSMLCLESSRQTTLELGLRVPPAGEIPIPYLWMNALWRLLKMAWNKGQLWCMCAITSNATYIAGYCTRAVVKKLLCFECKQQLIITNGDLVVENMTPLPTCQQEGSNSRHHSSWMLDKLTTGKK